MYGVWHRTTDLRRRAKVLEYLSELQPVPSVGLQDVPRESVGQHLGFGSALDAEPMDELDERLARAHSSTPSPSRLSNQLITQNTRALFMTCKKPRQQRTNPTRTMPSRSPTTPARAGGTAGHGTVPGGARRSA